MTTQNEESRHFSEIWEKVVQPVLDIVKNECDEEFSLNCKLRAKNLDTWKKSFEKNYRDLRQVLKEICYGNQNDSNKYLDNRKIAAILSKALMKEKVFIFDTKEAEVLLRKRKKTLQPDEFNRWAVHNVFINYKFAYYASLQVIYITLLNELLNSEETKESGIKLNNIGHLYRYPYSQNSDIFDVNMIIGMARSDLRGADFDMFLFAMQLYQIEMYTVEKLKQEDDFIIKKSR